MTLFKPNRLNFVFPFGNPIFEKDIICIKIDFRPTQPTIIVEPFKHENALWQIQRHTDLQSPCFIPGVVSPKRFPGR